MVFGRSSTHPYASPMPRSPHGPVAQVGDLLVGAALLLPGLHERAIMKLQLEAIVLHVFDVHLEHHLRRFAEKPLLQAFQLCVPPPFATSSPPWNNPQRFTAAGANIARVGACALRPRRSAGYSHSARCSSNSRMALISGVLDARLVDHTTRDGSTRRIGRLPAIRFGPSCSLHGGIVVDHRAPPSFATRPFPNYCRSGDIRQERKAPRRNVSQDKKKRRHDAGVRWQVKRACYGPPLTLRGKYPSADGDDA